MVVSDSGPAPCRRHAATRNRIPGRTGMRSGAGRRPCPRHALGRMAKSARRSGAGGRRVVVQVVVARPPGLSTVWLLRPDGELNALARRAGREDLAPAVTIEI